MVPTKGGTIRKENKVSFSQFKKRKTRGIRGSPKKVLYRHQGDRIRFFAQVRGGRLVVGGWKGRAVFGQGNRPVWMLGKEGPQAKNRGTGLS